MKKCVLILASLVMVLISGACDSDEDIKYSDILGDASYIYDLNLKIEDQSGNNLADGIELDGLTPSDYPAVYLRSVPLVSKDAYSLTMSFDDNLVVNNIQLFVLKDSQGGKVLNLAYYKSTFGEHSPNCEVRFVCPYIFGDSNEHVIKTTWKKKGYNNMCTGATFDGAKCRVEMTKEEKSKLVKGYAAYTYDITIVVNRSNLK